MPISPVASTLSILQALRLEKGADTQGARGARRRASAQRGDAGVDANALQSLRTALATIVAGIDPDDEAQVAAVRPTLVHAMLGWDLGPRLDHHPELPHLLQRIDAELARDVYADRWRDLVRHLQT